MNITWVSSALTFRRALTWTLPSVLLPSSSKIKVWSQRFLTTLSMLSGMIIIVSRAGSTNDEVARSIKGSAPLFCSIWYWPMIDPAQLVDWDTVRDVYKKFDDSFSRGPSYGSLTSSTTTLIAFIPILLRTAFSSISEIMSMSLASGPSFMQSLSYWTGTSISTKLGG